VVAVTFIIALAALILAVISFVRTGGIGDFRRQLETLNSRTETARDKTANALGRLEQFIRGKGRSPETGRESRGGYTPDQRG
jgi:hypothetical protein